MRGAWQYVLGRSKGCEKKQQMASAGIVFTFNSYRQCSTQRGQRRGAAAFGLGSWSKMQRQVKVKVSRCLQDSRGLFAAFCGRLCQSAEGHEPNRRQLRQTDRRSLGGTVREQSEQPFRHLAVFLEHMPGREQQHVQPVWVM